MSSEQTKNPARVAAGLKSTLARENVSQEAKERAEERLREMGDVADHEKPATDLTDRELAGYKSTLSSWFLFSFRHFSSSYVLHQMNRPRKKQKTHAREILEAAGETYSESTEETDEHQVRVLAGYKAALHNPRVSDEAKEHAREYLKEHGAL
ncbi:Conidiation protein 6-domain-containing protein [Mycena rebaudengoi]|nr:Conidiation protein 6-domain-containing protein [Mycena rebaudengoi]